MLSDLVDSMVGINGFGGLFSQLGYIVIRIWVEGVWSYNENQVALVMSDSANLWSWVPVTLGTPNINWIINVIKESKIDELLASLNGTRISHLLACHQAELSIRSEMAVNQTMGWTNLNQAAKTIKKEEIEAFLSKIIHVKTKTIFLGSNMHMMTQDPGGGWWTLLASWLECHEYLHWDDYQKQGSCSHGEKPDCHSDHHCHRCQGHSSSSHKWGAPGGGCTKNIGEAR